MDKVERDILNVDKLHSNTVESLVGAMKDLHSNEYVHGDLRPQNILAMPDHSVCIMHFFDWAGKIVDACYPHDLNMDVG